MPELIEVEIYRRALDRVLGQTLREAVVSPPAYLRPVGANPSDLRELSGLTLESTRRHGKLLLLVLQDGNSDKREIGLRFGMTGRLVVDGFSPIEQLEYSSARNDPSWVRATLRFDVEVTVSDPRRLGSLELAPDTSRLGVDATELTAADLAEAFGGRRLALKAALLNQELIAGLGNLLADEILWQVGMSPAQPAGSLSEAERDRLVNQIGKTLTELDARGGSHRGHSFALRHDGAPCSECGARMKHGTFGGRSTWWCPAHQGTR